MTIQIRIIIFLLNFKIHNPYKVPNIKIILFCVRSSAFTNKHGSCKRAYTKFIIYIYYIHKLLDFRYLVCR